MSFKDEYSEILKVIDRHKAKQIEMSKNLQIAYDYKESIINRMAYADTEIKRTQEEYHAHLVEMTSAIYRMKKMFDVEINRLEL